ncbi:MAG TPA: hypothetical protein VOA87_04035 [Thermoanaerobaculia bacterium]|nr:hypothetical protein [Thermoanaerobaculia bacterium]
MVRFALDEDIPDTILDSLKLGVREAELVPIRKIDPRLRQMDDWKLLLSLYHLDDWDGMITADSNILNLPRELAVIHQTNLTLVVIERAGHDPIRAAGLLLVHLPTISRKTVRTIGQIWKLNAQNKNHEDPWDELKKVADHQNTNVRDLFQVNKLSQKELRRNPLEELPFPG